MTINRAGIYPNMLAAEYFADPCPKPSLTQSLAKLLIARSPLHAKCAHPRLADPVQADEETVEKYVKAQAIGNAAHLLMIGRGKEIEIAAFDSWRTNDAKKVRENAERLGKVAIMRHHFGVAVRMVTAAREQLDAGGYAEAFAPDLGQGEVCVAWEESGVWFRSLIDWLPNDRRICWDYKTSEMSVAPHTINRMMVDMGWDIQAAMHERGLDHVTRDVSSTSPRFRFIAQEQEYPYPLIVCELSDDVMEVGRRKLAYAISIWKECMSTDQWPAYPLDLIQPTYPAWAESAWLQREIHEAAQERKPLPVNTMLAG